LPQLRRIDFTNWQVGLAPTAIPARSPVKLAAQNKSYLEAHQLIEDLIRIPIQLDALCYTWGSFSDKIVP
jgi:hypothetical protein